MFVNQKNTGFTLIEVMLAMTLLSIMMVLLFSSLRISTESWNKGEKKIAAVNEKAVVYQFFNRHLLSIRPLWDDFSSNGRRFSFQGEIDKFQFVSTFPASASRKGLQIFDIVFDNTDKGLIKVILKPFYPRKDEEEWQLEEEVLLNNVKKFEVNYFLKDEFLKTGSWQNNWQDKQKIPALIRVNIELNDESYWPEMIFALKLTGEQSDVFLGFE